MTASPLAIFERSATEGLFRASAAAEGPWTPGFCHGGAPAALAARTAEAVPTLAPMSVARVTLELMRPVPIGELRIDRRIVRDGKKLQIIEIEASSEERLVLKGTVLKLRKSALGAAAIAQRLPLAVPGPDAGVSTSPSSTRGFSSAFTKRSVLGGFETLGPASVWFRMDAPLVLGEETSACARAVGAADFANGIAGAVPFGRWSYPSTDLTVSFVRDPVGEWILVDAETWIGPEARGLTHARLGDQHGWFGRSAQTTIFEPRTPPNAS